MIGLLSPADQSSLSYHYGVDGNSMPMDRIRERELSDFTARPLFDSKADNADWPRITIVTPTLNQAPYIERTILSVLNQNYPNLEYMILDGGSTDGTLDIVKKYKPYLAYWRSTPDDGQAAALKEGFARATGEIFAWINSDDMYLRDVFKHVAGMMKAQPFMDVCYGNMLLIDSRGHFVGERKLTVCSTRFINLGFRYGGFGVYQPASFWRRETYEQVGGIDPSLYFDMDNDLFIRFVLKGSHFTFVPRSLVAFRIHEASKTFQLQDASKSEIPLLMARYHFDHGSIKAACIRSVVRLYRSWRYLIQGDAGYLLGRLLPHRWQWVP
jgi:glycosyltransferase involved in cell wall biosynthesis